MEAVVRHASKSPGCGEAGGVMMGCTAGHRALLLLLFAVLNLKHLRVGPWACLVHGC